MTYIRRATVGSLFASLLVMPSTGYAENNESYLTTVNATAGLAPVLSLSCTPVLLGVWRAKPGNRGGKSTIKLSIDGATTKFAISDNLDVSMASGSLSVPQAGFCSMFNSNNPGVTDAKLTISDSQVLEFDTANVLNRGQAKKALKGASGLKALLVVDKSGLAAVNSLGSATWRVLGTLEIPDGVVIDNYGGYRSVLNVEAVYRYPAAD